MLAVIRDIDFDAMNGSTGLPDSYLLLRKTVQLTQSGLRKTVMRIDTHVKAALGAIRETILLKTRRPNELTKKPLWNRFARKKYFALRAQSSNSI
jgi:hypothetical protein